MLIRVLGDIYKKNRKILFYLGFFLVSFLFSGDITFAEGQGSGIVTTVAYIIGLATAATFFIGVFLDPSWMNGSMFGLTATFKDIWILVSNIVYFVFAFLLIWIAFMNIIGKEGDQYQLKQALPKFIIGVLIVPISWFMVNFILSISAILTVSSLTLPSDTIKSYNDKTSEYNVCSDWELDLTSVFGKDDNKTETGESKFKNVLKCKDGSAKVNLQDMLTVGGGFSNSVGGLLSVYTMKVLKIDEVNLLLSDWEGKGLPENIGDAIAHVLFSALFIVIYSILIIVLCLVLVIRGIYLWLYLMLSPVFGLMYFFDKKDGGGDGFFAKFNLKEFIALALVPVYVMLALSFGMMFLIVIGQESIKQGNGDGLKSDVFHFKSVDGGGEKITLGDENNSEQSLSLTIKGGTPKTTGDNSDGGGIKKGIEWGFGFIGTLLMNIFGVVVFWIAIMTAMRTSEITKTVTEPIHAFGGQVGSLMAKSPQYLPVFGGQSMQSMQQIGSTASGHFETKARDKGTDFLKDNELFGQTAETESKAANALTALQKEKGISKNVVSKFSEAIHGFDNAQKASNSKSMVEASTILAKKLGIDENLYKGIKGDQNKFSKLMAHIDDKLDHEKANAFGTLIKDKEYTSSDANTLTADKFNKYLKSVKDGSVKDDNSSGGSKNKEINLNTITNSNIEIPTTLKTKSNLGTEIINERLVGGVVAEINSEVGKGKLNRDDVKKILINNGITEDDSINEVIKKLIKIEPEFFKEKKKKTD